MTMPASTASHEQEHEDDNGLKSESHDWGWRTWVRASGDSVEPGPDSPPLSAFSDSSRETRKMTAYSRFYLSDLQVHTIADKHHSYGAWHGKEDAFASKLIEAHAEQGVEVIAVTDHLTIEWWRPLYSAGQDQGVHVFPGMEISVNGCHLLVIWDATEDAFESAETFRRNLFRPGDSKKSTSGGYRVVTRTGVREIAEEAADLGGLVLAAHSTKQKMGLFAKGVCRDRADVAQSGLIAGFDMSGDTKNRTLDNPSTDFGASDPSWFISGDTRSFESVGQGACWLKLGDPPTLEGLRQAFLLPETRIVLPDRHRKKWGHVTPVRFAASVDPDWPRIESVAIDGGFHDGFRVEFGPGLNAIIGGKGTGKSALIEILRHVLDLEESDDHQLIENRLENLPANAEVLARLVDAEGTHYSVSRIGGKSPSPTLADADGKDTGLPVESRFVAQVFGQRELRRLAESRWLREFLASQVGKPFRAASSDEQKLLRNLANLESDLHKTETDAEDIAEAKLQLADLTEKVDRAMQEGAETEVERLKALAALGAELNDAAEWPVDVGKAVAGLRDDLLPKPEVGEHEEVPPDFGKALRTLDRSISHHFRKVEEAAKQANEVTSELLDQFNEHKAELETEISEKLADLGFAKPEELARDQAKIERLKRQTAKADEVQARLDELTKERAELLRKLAETRRLKSRLIDDQASKLNLAMAGRVRIQVTALGDKDELVALIRELAPSTQLTTIERAVRDASPQDMADAIRGGQSVLEEIGFTATAAGKLLGSSSQDLRRLETTDTPDLLRLHMNLGSPENPDWHAVHEVSPGQRATAVLSLAIAAGDTPLLIDQPEDDLDNRFIFNEVVRLLRSACQHRQVIVATHNANIPVLGDAECLIAFDATADRSRVLAIGGLEDPQVAYHARHILEGGDDAFRARQQRYARATD